MKEKNGITLIALIITIIVLLILAGVAVSIAISEKNVFDKASDARTSWNTAAITEQEKVTELMDALNTIIGNNNGNGEIPTSNNPTATPEGPTPTPTEQIISKQIPANHESEFVGKYADINGDGTIDGIIFVDLLIQSGTSGSWNPSGNSLWDNYGIYSITSTVTDNNVKDYVISQTEQTNSKFDSTKRDVVKLAATQTNPNPIDRFYVMGLDDITDGENNNLYWYYNALDMSDYASATSENFGKGRENTENIKGKWDLGEETGGYGETKPRDLWGNLQTMPKTGANVEESANDTETYRWFIPSKEEWSAFADAFAITSSTSVSFGLRNAFYWSSSQYGIDMVWIADFVNGCIFYSYVDYSYPARACATF